MSKVISFSFLALILCTTALAHVPAGTGSMGPYLYPNRTFQGPTGTAYPSGVALPTGGFSNPNADPCPIDLEFLRYPEGLHCGKDNTTVAHTEGFNLKVEGFCTSIDHWVLARKTMISTEYPIYLMDQENLGNQTYTPGSIVFAFNNHAKKQAMTMTYQSCKNHLHRLSKHDSMCIEPDNKGTKGGVIAVGHMTISARLHRGAPETPTQV